MNRETRSWVLGSTPVGCLARSVIMFFIPVVLGLWGLDQYLHWQAAQRTVGRPDSPAGAHPAISISVDLSHPLTFLVVVLFLVLVVAIALPGAVGDRRVAARTLVGAGRRRGQRLHLGRDRRGHLGVGGL